MEAPFVDMSNNLDGESDSSASTVHDLGNTSAINEPEGPSESESSNEKVQPDCQIDHLEDVVKSVPSSLALEEPMEEDETLSPVLEVPDVQESPETSSSQPTRRCYVLLEGQKCVRCDFKSTIPKYLMSNHVKNVHRQKAVKIKKAVTIKKAEESNSSIARDQLNEVKNGTCAKELRTKCRVCDKTFNRKDSLVLHLRTVHLKERRFKCEICQQGFTSNKDLTRHSAFVHVKQKDFVCKKCPMSFVTKKEVRRHTKAVHIRRKRNDSSSSSESKSEEEQDPTSFKCKKCDKTFNDLAKFRSHGEAKHKKAVTKRHQCLICDAILFDTSSLKRHHQVVHAKIKEFNCKVCLKNFAFKHDLVRHEKTQHSEVIEKPFQCDVCPLKFAFNWRLSRHKREVHLKISRKDKK